MFVVYLIKFYWIERDHLLENICRERYIKYSNNYFIKKPAVLWKRIRTRRINIFLIYWQKEFYFDEKYDIQGWLSIVCVIKVDVIVAVIFRRSDSGPYLKQKCDSYYKTLRIM